MKKVIRKFFFFFLYTVRSLDVGFIYFFFCFTSLKFTQYSSWSTCHVVTCLVTWENAEGWGIGIILVREEPRIWPTTILWCLPNKSPPVWCSLEREGQVDYFSRVNSNSEKSFRDLKFLFFNSSDFGQHIWVLLNLDKTSKTFFSHDTFCWH